METYKERMIDEYRELKEKYDKLRALLIKIDAGKLDFKLNCPLDLLKEQSNVMARYLYILEVRAQTEDIDLSE